MRRLFRYFEHPMALDATFQSHREQGHQKGDKGHARAEQWQAFDDEWKDALSDPPAIEGFHMADAVLPRDLPRLRKLAGIIRRHTLTGVAVTVRHDDYQAVFGQRVSKRLDRPYFIMYHAIIALVMQWEIANHIDEPIDFIFDEQGEESDYLLSLFSKFKGSLPEEFKRRLGNRPIYCDDVKVLPLQAADILAWTIRHVGHQSERGDLPIAALNDLFVEFPIAHVHVGREMLAQAYGNSRKRIRERGALFEHELEHVIVNMDAYISTFNRLSLERAAPNAPVALLGIWAKETKRFLLVHKCPNSDSPHLHRRSTNECMAERTTVPFGGGRE